MNILYIIEMIAIINFVVVFIIEYSGILFDLSKFLYSRSGRKWKYQMIGKPFGCSMCMTWWITLVYLLFSIEFLYAIGLAAMSSMVSVFTKKIIGLVLKWFNSIE